MWKVNKVSGANSQDTTLETIALQFPNKLTSDLHALDPFAYGISIPALRGGIMPPRQKRRSIMHDKVVCIGKRGN